MNRPRAVLSVCLLAVAVGASALRLPRLALRPMHGDEANQAVKAADLLESGRYEYDPHQHHGPSLYFLTLPSLWYFSARSLADTAEPMFRIVPAIFGIGLVLVVWPLASGLGRMAAVSAAVLTALSPAMVFYSRYYVQEILLVFFTAAAIAAGWQYARTRSAPWAVAAGACVGLMHATKETWVLSAAAMAVAGAAVIAWGGAVDGRLATLRGLVRRGHLTLAVLAAVLIATVLFSSFFTHFRGPLDSVLAYANYLRRAGGEGLHDNPWYYYLAMFANSRLVTETRVGPWWTEGFIMALALAGVLAAITRRGLGDSSVPLARFLAVYTVCLTVAYSAIPYKTPWCALGLLHGMILMAGVGAAAVMQWVPWRLARVAVAVVLAAGAAHLGWQAYRASFRFPADQRNPYVYAHTSPDVLNLERLVEDIAAVSPLGHDMIIKVMSPENYWPLPWYLRRFNRDHVGYYREVPDDADASVILASPELDSTLARRLRGSYNSQSMCGLRPQVFLRIYVEQSLWDAMLERRTRAASQRG